MGVDEAKADAEQPPPLDQRQDLTILGPNRLRQILKQAEHGAAIGKAPHRDLSGDEWMAEQPTRVEGPLEAGIGASQMIDPNSAVDEQQRALLGPTARPGRRRGIAATEKRQPTRRLTLDERFQGLAYQG